MKDYRAAKRYAEALFNLAQAENILEPVESELLSVAGLFKKEVSFNRFMSNAVFSLKEKEALLDKTLFSKISNLTFNFLKVLVRKKRFGELDAIRDIFHKLYEKSRGIQEVEVISAGPLSAAHKKRLGDFLKKKLSAEIRFIHQIRPEIIGGLMIRFGGKQIDGSYRGRLDSLKQSLLA